MLDVRAAAKQIASESVVPETDAKVSDVYSEFVRTAIQIRVPVRDRVLLRKHLQLLQEEIAKCEALLAQSSAKDPITIFTIASILRLANKKINAYRRIRNF